MDLIDIDTLATDWSLDDTGEMPEDGEFDE